MKRFNGKLLALACAFSFSAISYGAAANGQAFSPDQQQQIKQIVHDYLVSNPEVLIEASQALQSKEVTKAKEDAIKGISSNKSKVFNDPASPTAGNSNGKAIVVEFFDYQCVHCKEMQPTLEKLFSTNQDVKVIYKEFPIFGDASTNAAKMALAAAKQNKYKEFHDALFKVSGPLNQDKLEEVAKSVGLNVDQLKKDSQDPAIQQEISSTYELAKALSLVGTPSFILSNKEMTEFDFIPGAAPGDSFLKAVNDISKK